MPWWPAKRGPTYIFYLRLQAGNGPGMYFFFILESAHMHTHDVLQVHANLLIKNAQAELSCLVYHHMSTMFLFIYIDQHLSGEHFNCEDVSRDT